MSLRQSSIDSSRPRASETDRRSSLCWRAARDLPCLRIETEPDEIFIFPYQQFQGAHYNREGEEDRLIISFPEYEVTVSGRQLDELVMALQELSIAWIKTIPAPYRKLPDNDAAWITQIDVKVVE